MDEVKYAPHKCHLGNAPYLREDTEGIFWLGKSDNHRSEELGGASMLYIRLGGNGLTDGILCLLVRFLQ